jgi:excinuclease UvrABC ATPase subunit
VLTGVSGSGKSTSDSRLHLCRHQVSCAGNGQGGGARRQAFQITRRHPTMSMTCFLGRLPHSPVRSARRESNPVTLHQKLYVCDSLRRFAETREAQARGIRSLATFTCNCPAAASRCLPRATAHVTVEMQFLADVELVLRRRAAKDHSFTRSRFSTVPARRYRGEDHIHDVG